MAGGQRTPYKANCFHRKHGSRVMDNPKLMEKEQKVGIVSGLKGIQFELCNVTPARSFLSLKRSIVLKENILKNESMICVGARHMEVNMV